MTNKPEKRSLKNHYMQVTINLEKYKNRPVAFLKNIAWGGNINNSFYIDQNNKKKFIPLNQAPEWVMNNFWLLRLGEIEI